MPPKVAAITMAYNEAVLLPVWARHYARQVGADHCYVIDHGSTDPIVVPAGMNTLRLPRSPHDDTRRAGFVSDLATALLKYYDWILYTDVDELVLADPKAYRNIADFCGTLASDTVTAIGLDLQHVPGLEPDLDYSRPIGLQRAWVRFTSAMCKPVLTRQSITWSPGFHCSEHPLAFAGLYLLHLHWSDQSLGCSRLQKTRRMPWSDSHAGQHQRIVDHDWLRLFEGMASLPRRTAVDLAPDQAPLREWLERTRQSAQNRAGNTYAIDLALNAPELWEIPAHFRASF